MAVGLIWSGLFGFACESGQDHARVAVSGTRPGPRPSGRRGLWRGRQRSRARLKSDLAAVVV